MINLVDLYYQINKDIFFTDKISEEAFTIYTNKLLPDIVWNYAAISNLSALKKNYAEICDIFAKLNRRPSFYLREDQQNDMCDLINQKILIKYPESWLRYENDNISQTQNTHQVKTKREQQVFLELFKKMNAQFYSDMETFADLFQKTFSAQNFYHFMAYHQEQAVAIAVLGVYNGYAIISHLQTLPEYQGQGYTASILKSCINKFSELGGKELYIQLLNTAAQEKWCIKKGFQKMFNGYLLR